MHLPTRSYRLVDAFCEEEVFRRSRTAFPQLPVLWRLLISRRSCHTFVGRVVLSGVFFVLAAHKRGSSTSSLNGNECNILLRRVFFKPLVDLHGYLRLLRPTLRLPRSLCWPRPSKHNSQLVQFLRLLCLSGEDSFLLESIFRNEVWEFMEEPVSRSNEEAVNEALSTRCVYPLVAFHAH